MPFVPMKEAEAPLCQHSCRIYWRHSFKIGASLKRLNPIISHQDRNKLDFHLNAIREVEERLTQVTDAGSCIAFSEDDKLKNNPEEQFGDEILNAYIDLVVAAFICDLSRVATFQMSFGHDFHSYPWLGLTGDFHGWTHNKVGTGGASLNGAQGRINAAMAWRHEKIVRLMDKLKAVQEPDGTLLDNSGILMWTETSREHFYNDATWVLGGRMGGQINTGHHTKYSGVDHNKLLTTIAQAMGMQTNRFGAAQYQSGTLDGLLKA